MLDGLKELGLRVLVVGTGWESCRFAGPPVFGEELGAIIRRSKVCVNFYRQLNNDSETLRPYEILGFGGTLVTEVPDENDFISRYKLATFGGSIDDSVARIAKVVLDDHELAKATRQSLEAARAMFVNNDSFFVDVQISRIVEG